MSRVAISAGHYPRFKGASFNGFNEYDEAIKWVEKLLTLFGNTAVGIKTGPLPDKIRQVNSLRVSLALEIHFNSGVGKVRGSETLYCVGSKKGKRAASLVQNALASLMPPNRGIKEGWYKMDRPGIVDYPGDIEGDEYLDAFLVRTNCPAIILEPEFIQNINKIEVNRDFCCEVIYEAVCEFLKE